MAARVAVLAEVRPLLLQTLAAGHHLEKIRLAAPVQRYNSQATHRPLLLLPAVPLLKPQDFLT